MNYLSHHYFDQKSDDCYYLAGIALPDLVKTCNRKWNVHPELNSELSKIQNSIHQGWHRHLKVDSLFHNSDFFSVQTEKIKNSITHIEFGNRNIRPFVLAHIGLELILDHFLLKNKMVNTDLFYQKLGFCETKELSFFLHFQGIENSLLFEKFYSDFIGYRYLNNYQNNENFAYALNRICKKVFKAEIHENKQLELGIALKTYIDDSEKTFMSIFNEISQQLK